MAGAAPPKAAVAWVLDDKEPRSLGLSKGYVTDAEVVAATQHLERFLMGEQGRITFPATISVHVEGKGFGDQGGIALLRELTTLHEQQIITVNELFMFKLKLTDAACGPLADLIVAHKGAIESLHLSHNQITSAGAKLLCEKAATVYPIKNNAEGTLVTPLWLRMEHNKIDPATLTLAPELYTVKQHRLRKLKPPAPPLQLPHIGLGDPQASRSARANAGSGPGGRAAGGRQPVASQPGGVGGAGGGGNRRGGGQGGGAGGAGLEEGGTARAMFYGDKRWYGCRLGAATAQGRLCMFVGYEQDGWQDTLVKDIRAVATSTPSGTTAASGGPRPTSNGASPAQLQQQQQQQQAKGSGAVHTGDQGVQTPGEGTAGGGSKARSRGGRKSTGSKASPGPVGGGGAGGGAPAPTDQMAGLSVSGRAGGAAPGSLKPNAGGAGAGGAWPSKQPQVSAAQQALQSLEADLVQAQMLLRGSYRSQKGSDQALNNAAEARSLCEAALAKFREAGDDANSFRCLAVSGEALMREAFVRVCRGEPAGAVEGCGKAGVKALESARGMLDGLVAGGHGACGQQMGLSLDMASENVEKHKRELAERLAECGDQNQVLALRTSLESAIQTGNELQRLR